MKNTMQSTAAAAAAQARTLMATIRRIRGNSDGCTMVPDFQFRECCVAHDVAYRLNPDGITRAQADKRLRACMRSKGYWFLAPIYWLGVRLLGRKGWKK